MTALDDWQDRQPLAFPPYPVRPEPRPCKDCGEPIDPGQSYLPRGPLHVYCGAA